MGGPGKAAANFQNKAGPPGPKALQAAHSALCNTPEHSCFLSPLSTLWGPLCFQNGPLGDSLAVPS